MTVVPDRAAQLRIRAEIEELNAEFAYLIDHDRCEAVAELFTENGSYGRATGERSTGRDAIRRAYAARKAKGPRTARHIFTNLRLTYETTERVRAMSILTLFAADGAPPHVADPFLVADYDDVCERCADGRWRFASRTVSWLFVQRDGEVSPLPLGADRGGK